MAAGLIRDEHYPLVQEPYITCCSFNKKAGSGGPNSRGDTHMMRQGLRGAVLRLELTDTMTTWAGMWFQLFRLNRRTAL